MANNCTWEKYARYNIGWDGGLKDTGDFVGVPAFGKDYYGNYRAFVLQIKTPPTISSNENIFQIQMLTCRAAYSGSGTDTWYYAIMDTSYNFNDGSGGSTPIPNLPPTSGKYQTGSFSLYSPSQNSGYLYQTIQLDPFTDIKADTSYQIWFWSDTPYVYHGSTSGIGYICSKASYGGTIVVSLLQSETSSSPEKPDETTKDYFEWEIPKTKDNWQISAHEWNAFCRRVNSVLGINIENDFSSGEYFTAEMYNQAAEALGLKTRVFIKGHFNGEHLNNLVTALNAKI